MERNHDMVYVCYDNGAYMNTGIQRSSATPMYADTTTTPVGSQSNGKPQNRKDLASVIAAHDIPYVAQTTFVQNFKDLHIKSEKAIYTPGAAFLTIRISIYYGSLPPWMEIQYSGYYGNLQTRRRDLLLASL